MTRYISRKTADLVGPRLIPLLEQELQDFYEFMLEKGKDPKQKEGLAGRTAQNYLNRFDQLQRIAYCGFTPELLALST